MENQSMIKVKGGYSDSKGIVPYREVIQISEFDDRARTILSNTMFDLLKLAFESGHCSYKYSQYGYDNQDASDCFCQNILSNVFALPTMNKRGYIFDWRSVFKNNINSVFLMAPYNEVLDIIWYICRWLDENMFPIEEACYDVFNSKFEQENIGYRFVNGMIVAITDELEISEIEDASNCSIGGCKQHIQKAVGFLSDRGRKDYKNCIKESVSAVEAACRVITGDDNASLGQALRDLKNNGVILHPSLEKTFSALYGYASNEGGIRHSEGEVESSVSFDEAKFILVSCCAFVNYLIALSQKNGD